METQKQLFNSNAVSAAKACAILLMVAGHAAIPGYLQDYLYMMRMPVFFIMSGYCFKMKYLDDAKTFIKRRFTGIWWPYVKWGLFFLVLHNVLFHLNIYNDVYGYKGTTSHLYTWQEFLKNGVKTLCFANSEQLLGGFWFLKVLFWASLLGYVCIKYLRKFEISGGVVLIILFVSAYWNIKVLGLGLLPCPLMATFFFLFGHAWRENEERGGFMTRFYALGQTGRVVVIVLLAAAVKGFEMIIGPTSMLTITFGNAAFYMCGALCGTMMVYFVCCRIVSNPNSMVTGFLTFTGRHTFEVLTWHFLCFKLVSVLIISIYGLVPERLATFPVISTAVLRADGIDVAWTFWWVVYLIVGAGIPILWQYVRFRMGKEKRRY